jgi:peptidoglycan/LPS O-acetylase OafA/YrhL
VGVRFGGLNPGVTAVVGFYLVSGYVMSSLIQRHYSQPQAAPGFYLDRALRLLPQYFFYASITLAWQLYSQANTLFLTRAPSASDIFNNLLIVPLNYYMFNGSDQYTLIPPAWSLGAEIQFYLIAPFVLTARHRLLTVGAISLCVYGAAAINLIHSEWFGYRLLPGVLLFFMLGANLQQRHQRQTGARAAAVYTFACAALAMIALQWLGRLHQPYNLETLLGLMLGLPVLHLLARRIRTWWDDLAGDLSYGVFLNHFLVHWVLFPQGVSAAQLPAFVLVCIALSWLSQRFIERPWHRQRQHLRHAKLLNC